MTNIKVPILVNGATLNPLEIDFQRLNGSIATELHTKTQINGPCYTHWKLNESSGLIVPDSSGNERHGSNDGANWVFGKIGNALSFNGINQRALWDEYTCDFEWNKVFSIEMWIKANPTSSVMIVLCKQSSTGNSTGFNIHIDVDGYINFVTRYDGTNRMAIEIPKDIRDATWHHFVIIYGGSGQAADCKMYLDGVNEPFLIVNDNMTLSIKNTAPFQISGRDTGYYFDGMVDEVVVYEKALTEAEILFRYNNGNGTEDIITGYPFQTETELIDLDGHYSNSTWDLSTFEIFENPNSEQGILKYQYAIGNTSNPSNWNGIWLTKSELQSQSNIQSRYLKIKILFESNGEQKTALSDGFIECDMPLLVCDYPSINDVRNEVPYNNGNLIGNIVLPSENKVLENETFGSDATEFQGNVHLPQENEVKESIEFGANSNEFTGNVTLPNENDVRNDVLYGSNSNEFAGNCKLPAEENVQYGISYGANGYEYEGKLIGGDIFQHPVDISINTEQIIIDIII